MERMMRSSEMKSMVKSVLIGFIRFLYQTRFDVQTIGLELREIEKWRRHYCLSTH
jgi:hypothetical protein